MPYFACLTTPDGGLLTDPDKGSVTQLGIRPENITVVEAGKGQIDGDIDLVEYLGADTFLIVSCGELGRITVRITGVNELETAMRIGLSFSAEKMHYFDSEGYAL